MAPDRAARAPPHRALAARREAAYPAAATRAPRPPYPGAVCSSRTRDPGESGGRELSHEQARAVALASRGSDARIVARAGSGKTSTLAALAEASPAKRALYLAFNRSIAAEARQRFPRHVRVTTLHALAYAAVVGSSPAFRRKFRSGGGRLDTPTLTRLAGLEGQAIRGRAGTGATETARHAAHVRATLAGFCASADASVTRAHVPPGLRRELAATLPPERLEDRTRWLARRAQRVWSAMADPEHEAPLDFDGFLKLYQLRRPAWSFEVLLVDEAQDLNPVMLTLLAAQTGQRVLVGDPQQQIYAWRGAIDALGAFRFPRLHLTRSFRFGAAIAGAARRVLTVVTPDAQLSGVGPPGELSPAAPEPSVSRTVLCRTHAGLIEAALELGERGVHLTGGVQELTATLRALHALRCGRATAHPALHGARSWEELGALAESAAGPVRTLHRIAERYGGQLPRVAAALEAAHRPAEQDAPLCLSTLHKAKGREWPVVELWGDLPRVADSPGRLRAAPDPDAMRAELNLLYVGVTRARRTLYFGRVAEEVRSLLLGERSGA